MKAKKCIQKALTAVLAANIILSNTAFTGTLYTAVTTVHAETAVGTEVVSCPKQTIVDPLTGRTYYYMNVEGKTTVRAYVTMQSWSADGTKFVVMTPDDNKMYEYDTVNETLRFLDYASGSSAVNAVVTPDNQIYYTYNKNIYKIDWNTYTRTLVTPFPYGCSSVGNMQITNDGRYINGYYSGAAGGNTVFRIDAQNGIVDTVLKKDFSYNPNTQGVGHPIINPEYPELLFFCHEGTTTLIPDRLWLANADTGDMFNLFVQSERDDGLTGECSGHEVWGMDGEYMYFVKYSQTQNLGQNGLMRVTKDGSEREYINGDFAYWHCYPSSDNNWVVGDTNTGQIAIANTKTHESELLVKFRMYNWQHPYQPHPVMSYSNNAVSWQMVNDANICGIGWTDITDLTSQKVLGGKSEFNTRTNIISYENAVSTSSKTVKNGINCISAEGGKSIFVDVKDNYIKNTNQRLSLTLGYMDVGTQPLSVIYSSGVNSNRDLHKFEDNEILIAKNNTGKEMTAEIDLGYVNVNNIGNFRSDLRISSGSEAVYVTDIKPKIMSDDYSEVHKRGSFVISGNEDDITKGIYALSANLSPDYNNRMFPVSDTSGCTAAGISSDDITAAKNSGSSYITCRSDGGWIYRTATDGNGITKQAWFTSKNYRADKDTLVGGTVYYRLSDDYISLNDKNLKFYVEYLDNGTANITFKYYSTSGIKSVNIKRTGTNTWKTAVIDVSDALISSGNSGTALATGVEDFMLGGNYADTYISKVFVIKQKDYDYIDIDDYIPPANADDNPTVFVVSDTFGADVPGSEFPRAGWGMEIDRYFAPGLSFVNMSAKVMSTQAFLDGSYRDDISQKSKQGDYLLVQLGADEESVSAYKSNLKAIADYSAEQGLNLVFLTPAHKRVFASDGTLADDGAKEYRTAMASAGEANGVPVLKVGEAHGELIEKLGVEGSKQIFMYADANAYPGCTYENLSDDTTVNQRGALEISKIITNQITQYKDSGLESLAVLAGYADASKDTTAMEAPVYQPVSAKTDITDVMYIVDGSPSSSMRPGEVGVKLKVTNKAAKASDAILYTAVYDKEGRITDIAQSDKISIQSGGQATLETDAVTLPEGEGYKLKKFVWTSDLRPYSQRAADFLGLTAEGHNGRAIITWQRFSGLPEGTYFEIYRDGIKVGRTDSTSFIDENVPRGEHSWQVNAYNSLGIFLYQSNYAVDFVSGMEDVSDDVFYAKAFIDSEGNPADMSKNMNVYISHTYYPILEARKHYPHVTVKNLLEAYSYRNIKYITNGSDGSTRRAKVTDANGITKDAWQTARVYRVTPTGATAVRDCFMYFNFEDGTITPSDHKVTVYVEYLADRASLRLQYANCIIDGEDVTATDENGVRLSNSAQYGDTATGTWRVARFELDDAYFNEAGTTFVTGKCDMRLASDGADLTVSSVTVVKGNATIANEEISKLGNMEFYDGYVYEGTKMYPEGVSYNVTTGEEVCTGIRNFRMTEGETDAIGTMAKDVDRRYYIAPSADGESQNYLCFDVDDRYMFGGADSRFEIEITYKADFDGNLIMRTHSRDFDTGKLSDVSDLILTSVTADDTWKTEVFTVDGATFINTLTGGCDFALYTPMGESANQLKVRKITIKNATSRS